jgi:hypothetical protein
LDGFFVKAAQNRKPKQRVFRKKKRVQIFAPCKNGTVDLQPVKRKKKKIFFKKTSKTPFSEFYLDSKLKSRNPKMPLEISVMQLRTGFECHFRHFSMLQIATALFSIKTPKFQGVFGTFCIFRFFAFFFCKFVTFRKKMSDVHLKFGDYLRRAYSVKHVFQDEFPISRNCVSWDFQIPDFRISDSSQVKHVFFTFIRLQPENKTPMLPRGFDFPEGFQNFRVSGLPISTFWKFQVVQKIYVLLYFIIDFK